MEEKEPYFQVPKSLFRLRKNNEISLIAIFIYMLMLDRYKLSESNSWVDKEGEVYIFYSYEELMEDLGLKKKNTISNALKELENLKLIKKKKRYKNSSVYYLENVGNQKLLLENESNQNDNVGNQKLLRPTSQSNQNDNVGNQKLLRPTSQSNQKYTLIRTTYINNNNINNNNNIIDPALKNEIHLLLKGRNIKANQITKICIDIQRIKEVIDYADKKELGNGFIIKALKENWKLGLDIQASSKKSGLDIQADKNNSLGLDIQANSKNPESQGKKDYSMSIDEALKRSRNKK